MRKVPEVFKTHQRGACRGSYLPSPFSHVPVIPGVPPMAFPSWVKAAFPEWDQWEEDWKKRNE